MWISLYYLFSERIYDLLVISSKNGACIHSTVRSDSALSAISFFHYLPCHCSTLTRFSLQSSLWVWARTLNARTSQPSSQLHKRFCILVTIMRTIAQPTPRKLLNILLIIPAKMYTPTLEHFTICKPLTICHV